MSARPSATTRGVVGARARRGGQPLVQAQLSYGGRWPPRGPSSRPSAAIRPGADWQAGAATTRTSATSWRTGSPRSRSTGPRCATPSGPQTLIEVSDALERAREDSSSRRDRAHRRGPARLLLGRRPARARRHRLRGRAAPQVGRFHVTDLHVQMRRLPKPIVAMVAGYAIGGGHVLHVVCDLTIAADNARFGQTGPKVGSFDGGFGAEPAGRPRSARRRPRRSGSCAASTTPQEALDMGLVNTVVPLEELEEETVRWCREMLALSPFSLRLLKASFNAAEDGLAGHPAAGPRREPALLRAARRRRRAARPTRTSAARTSASSRSAREPSRVAAPRAAALAAGRPAAHAARRGRAGAGGHRARRHRGRLPARCAFVAALVGSVFIQIGTNLSNDYSDARRGADTEDRLGPGAGDRRRPDAAAAGAGRHLRGVRRSRWPRAST